MLKPRWQLTDWKKVFLTDIFGFSSKSELLSFDWLGDKSALKAIEKDSEPRLVGEHLYVGKTLNLPKFASAYIENHRSAAIHDSVEL